MSGERQLLSIDSNISSLCNGISEGSDNGVTTDSYKDIVDIDGRGLKTFTILMKNLSTNPIDYKLLSYANYSGDLYYEETSGNLSATDTIQFCISEKRIDRLKLQVKTVTNSSFSGYNVEYVGAVR